MEQKIYIADDLISLSEYIEEIDDYDCYTCWQDEETQNGYNFKCIKTFDEWSKETTIKSQFIATIVRLNDNACIGSIFLSSENTPPDLAIMIYKPYRKQGFGTRAFSLGVKHCFETLILDKIYAGCYPHNKGSIKMLEKCGFLPHPEGNVKEKHYITGEDIIQLGYIIHNPLL